MKVYWRQQSGFLDSGKKNHEKLHSAMDVQLKVKFDLEKTM